MQILEKSKEEIETKANKMQDFLKIEYLEECSKRSSSIGVLRYCFLELSKLYERHSMYSDAVKYIVEFRRLNIGNNERTKAYLREIELLIKGGFYDKADFLLKELMRISGTAKEEEIIKKVTDTYKKEAARFELAKKYSPLQKVYQRLVYLVDENEKAVIQKRMIKILGSLGKIRESIELERGLV